MNKYINNLSVDQQKGLPFYKTVIPSKIPTEDLPYYYISQEGDRFDTLSSLFYKTPNNWWAIAKANNLNNGSMGILPGTRLFIPNV